MADDVDAVMQTIPEKWRTNWCGAELCACLGCVQVGNRIAMAKELGIRVGDPEYIDERKIPPEIYKKYKVTREEWEEWMRRQS